MDHGISDWPVQGQRQLGLPESSPRLLDRNVLVLRGDRALTPPEHGSSNMRKAMEDAMPEYERLQRAVDG